MSVIASRAAITAKPLSTALSRGHVPYVLRKVVHAVLVVVAAYSATFFLLFVLPGDAILARIGTQEALGTSDLQNLELDTLRQELGLSDPLWLQYLRGLGGLATGSLGRSLVSGLPVADLIFEALPNTLILAGVSLLVSVPLGFLLALLAVYPRSRAVRSVAALVPAAYTSLPVFWVGILLIFVFSITLGWLPAFGSSGPESLILPVTVLALGGAAQFAQVLISSLRAELDASYAAVTAPAKGAGRLYTIVRHCLRNAAFPFLTVFGLRVGTLLGGTVVVELVFSRSGIGRLMVESVKSVDLTVVLGIVALIAVVYVVVNILVDIGYLLLDPRLRRRPALVEG
ncbi:ABC transporter permease [Microbacterium ulmi]|uniref:ABC transporter permease n=1 Tax=Microbacterium ulmi TaxID=179095 RepID=A0A7Y2Q078_9MICO|nr:ABC transporter permease [Microbacterium ulmi]NII69298.1 peptide/nickel transport system permease protein [Microbacterium ulmi]NNH04088.1 ABC transporter permease [Microbacterium ulmi]